MPEGCAWDGARIDRDRVHARYRCGERAIELELVHPDTAPAGAPRAGAFSVESADGAEPALVEAVLAGLAQTDPWTRPRAAAEPHTTVDRPTATHPAAWAFLAVAIIIVVAGALVQRGRPRDPPKAEPRPELRLLAILLAIVWLASISLDLACFRLVLDDFGYLVTARAHAFSLDTGQRLLGVRLPFFVAAQAGERAALVCAALNLAALVALLVVVMLLSRRLGASREGSWIVALLVGLCAPALELARWASGFQQLAGLALVCGAILALDAGLASPDRRRKLGLVCIGAGLSMLAVLTKWQVSFLAPAGALVLTHQPGSLRRALGLGALASSMAVPLCLPGLEIPGEQAGIDHVPANSLALLAELAALSVPLLGVLAVVALVSRRTAVEMVGIARAPSARPVRALALVILFAIPFALNRLYFVAYYTLFPWVWLASWLGTILASAWRPSPRVGTLLAIASTVALAPVGPIAAALRREPENDVGRWVDEAVQVLEAEPRLVSVSLYASCADESDTRRSEVLLRRYLELSDGGMAFRWRLGLDPALPIGIDRDARTTLLYCEDASPRFRSR